MIVWYITENNQISSGILTAESISSSSNTIIPFFVDDEQMITVDRVFKSKLEARQYLEESKKEKTDKKLVDKWSEYYDVETREYRIPWSILEEEGLVEDGNNQE